MTALFGEATWHFLDGLAADNTKRFFDEHREVYKRHVAEPSADFVTQLAPALRSKVHPALEGEPKVGRSLFRINRDLRFAKDATPYRTHLDFLFWIGDDAPREKPACILRLTSSTVLLGAGQLGVRGAPLDRYRRRLDDPVDGAVVRRIVDEATTAGSRLSDASRVHPPRPMPRDHPNRELLRRDGFHLSHEQPHPDEIATDRFATWCADELVRYRPLLDWLVDASDRRQRLTPDSV